jgi:hypothetical protein
MPHLPKTPTSPALLLPARKLFAFSCSDLDKRKTLDLFQVSGGSIVCGKSKVCPEYYDNSMKLASKLPREASNL